MYAQTNFPVLKVNYRAHLRVRATAVFTIMSYLNIKSRTNTTAELLSETRPYDVYPYYCYNVRVNTIIIAYKVKSVLFSAVVFDLYPNIRYTIYDIYILSATKQKKKPTGENITKRLSKKG